MDRFDYEAHMALGLLYKKEFAGAEDEQAIKHLDTALLLRPDLYHLDFQLGQLYARIDRDRARKHYTRFLNAPIPEEDPDRELARRARDELNREPTAEDLPFLPEPPRDLQRLDPELQRMINEAYLRVSEEQDFQQAERVLERARKKFPHEEVVLNELAKVAYAMDRRGDAREFWEKSLEMKEDQMEGPRAPGSVARGRPARRRDRPPEPRRRARASTARFRLAQLLWSDFDLFEASDELDRYPARRRPLRPLLGRRPAPARAHGPGVLRIYLAIGALCCC
jgi:tetratricopeptide (TPR) repeat protein